MPKLKSKRITTRTSVATALLNARSDSSTSQITVVRKVNKSQPQTLTLQTYRRYESGQRPVPAHVLLLLSEVLGLPPTHFLAHVASDYGFILRVGVGAQPEHATVLKRLPVEHKAAVAEAHRLLNSTMESVSDLKRQLEDVTRALHAIALYMVKTHGAQSIPNDTW